MLLEVEVSNFCESFNLMVIMLFLAIPQSSIL